ncbi:MAG TPA: FAD-dependent oxidoreductase [Bryobacteraceae bacterium]|nr:FAD-dependent oxidoreductase [Bryobacteraceae bacterium]
MQGHSLEVVIIGGGIIGGSIAWRLAQAGAEVTLLDAGKLGGEASWAGAGMLAPGGEIAARNRWAAFWLQSLILYPEFVAELQSETGLGIDYLRCGAFEVAHTDAEWQDLLGRREVQSEMGIRAEVTVGGIYYPDDALVDPRDVTRALRCACDRRGVHIHEQTRVLAVRIEGQRVDVETAGSVLSGSAAVLAAGAWSGAIPVFGRDGRIAIPASFPVRGHLLGYTLEPGSVGPIRRHGHTYVMQRSSGFTIAGSSTEQAGFNREVDPQIVADIRARACQLLPELLTAPEPAAWLGFRPATEGFEPAIGRLGDTCVWLAYGHYRNGILLAPATAARVAREIVEWPGAC